MIISFDDLIYKMKLDFFHHCHILSRIIFEKLSLASIRMKFNIIKMLIEDITINIIDPTFQIINWK